MKSENSFFLISNNPIHAYGLVTTRRVESFDYNVSYFVPESQKEIGSDTASTWFSRLCSYIRKLTHKVLASGGQAEGEAGRPETPNIYFAVAEWLKRGTSKTGLKQRASMIILKRHRHFSLEHNSFTLSWPDQEFRVDYFLKLRSCQSWLPLSPPAQE